MGYRITGSTRKERWETLKKAIPVMGLRKIVTIISANVRIKKKQKSSDQQSHYAITEWEYDLSQLKEKYFHGEFKWPNT
ncbi:hypothetical protein BBI08_15955 [Planococcus halocryophilus]|uniref:Uncharacterized protein n=2 Tax=Planococcus halocryophilus TaxID=1215089 RepID=A0A1C7DV17_9BACL|nr:hypothetical protein BBI08_15955 [Planococcus halocryophilus]